MAAQYDRRFAFVTVFLSTIAAVPVCADEIPYPNVGTIAPTHTFTVSATGNIDAYFYGFSAAGTDYVDIVDVTQGTSTGWIFDNQTTPVGQLETLAGVHAGDNIEFRLDDLSIPGEGILTSNPSDSADGINHAYATTYTATGPTAIAGIPPGVYIGMEDEAYSFSDLDYNDDQFVVTNVVASPPSATPEPTSMVLMLAGLGLLTCLRQEVLRRTKRARRHSAR